MASYIGRRLFSMVLLLVMLNKHIILRGDFGESAGDYTGVVFGFMGLATPNFLLALTLMFLFQRYFGWSPGGLLSPDLRRRARLAPKGCRSGTHRPSRGGRGG